MNFFYQKIFFALLGGFVAAAGGVTVSLWSDHLVRKREKQVGIENRRRDFLAFMEKWKAEVERGFAANTFIRTYSDWLPEFKRQASLIRNDFADTKRTRFNELVLAASGFKNAENITQNPDKQEILDVIDALIRFTHETDTTLGPNLPACS